MSVISGGLSTGEAHCTRKGGFEKRNLNLTKPQIHREYRRQRNKLDTHKEANISGYGTSYRAVAQVSISQWSTDKTED